MLKTVLSWLMIATTCSLAHADRPAPATQPADTFPVSIRVDAAHPGAALKPIWRFFGADEPNYAYMKDGKKLLRELGQLGPAQAYFRTHNLLTSGDGTPALKWGSTNAYHEDAQGQPVYDWTIVDRIFDTYRSCGLMPYVEIGFMPRDLSTHPDPYQHHWHPGAKYDEIYTGWAYPPKDEHKWADLVYAWTRHNVERYGRAAVARWYWETWNEPNIAYWRGTPEEFYRLHDLAIDAVRRALPEARVGGPDSAGGGTRFLRNFLEHCTHGTDYATNKRGTPLDFVSFHAKGAPTFVQGHVRLGIAHQLRDIDSAFKIIASFPELKDKPIVIGESDPDGCAACQGPQLGYRNTTMYASYTAACIAREYELAERHGVNLEGALTWAFEFEDQPYFAGFRALATNGIDLPVLNVFRLLGKMEGGRRLPVQSDAAVPLDAMLRTGVRAAPDVQALATQAGSRTFVLIWHYHDDDVPGPDAEVRLDLSGLPIEGRDLHAHVYRLDGSHGNAYSAWQSMGAPPHPTPEQYVKLEQASALNDSELPEKPAIASGHANLHLRVPRQGLVLLVLE